MTNAQLYIAIGIPTLFALVGILTNITLYALLFNRVDGLGNSLRAEMSAHRTELIDRLDKLNDRLHDDMRNIMGRDREMDKRVMKLEPK